MHKVLSCYDVEVSGRVYVLWLLLYYVIPEYLQTLKSPCLSLVNQHIEVRISTLNDYVLVPSHDIPSLESCQVNYEEL